MNSMTPEIALAQPIALLSGLTLKNRLVIAPMTTYSSLPDGNVDPEELSYLGTRSRGYGMVQTAACAVNPRGKAFDGQWACWGDEFLPSLASMADAIHEGGAAAVLQIHHGGRMCPSRLCGGVPLSASAVPADRPTAETPAAMTTEEIETAIDAYAQAALRAKKAGYDGVEIHGANTYLIQQFVSPHSNRREDEYGQDRLLFARRVVEAVLAAVGPGFSVGYRFSPEENETPGIRLSDTQELVEMLLGYPLDYLHVSLWKLHSPSLHNPESEPVLTTISRWVNGRMPVIGVSGVFSSEDAFAILQDGADLVAVGRAAIIDPDSGIKLLAGEPLFREIPAEGAREKLTLPKGLADKIYAVKGWFPVASE